MIHSALEALWLKCSIRHPMQRFGYRYASALLKQVLRQACIDPRQVHSICDFGAGLGGPSLALQSCFSQPLKQLVLLEANPLQSSFAKKLLLSAEVFQGNGLDWLERTERRFDLITAFMLGPDYDDDGFVRHFLAAALNRLNEKGSLLIASDVATMQVVQGYLQEQLVMEQCFWVNPTELKKGMKHSLKNYFSTSFPYTVIFSKEGDAKLQKTSMEVSFPKLPAPVFYTSSINQEVYCLSTAFERKYLKATFKTYQQFNSGHSIDANLQQLLLCD
jgi:hypothetical protein